MPTKYETEGIEFYIKMNDGYVKIGEPGYFRETELESNDIEMTIWKSIMFLARSKSKDLLASIYLKINVPTRKRFVKLLQALGVQRNDTKEIVRAVQETKCSYTQAYIYFLLVTCCGGRSQNE